MVKINEWHNNIIKEGEQVSAIPYTLLHNLEEKYGTVKNVPESNLTLQKIRKIIGFSTHEDSKQAMYQDDIKYLLRQGYRPKEIADKLVVSQTTVRIVMRKNHYKVMPRFKYRLVNSRANFSFFANNQNELIEIINHSCRSLDECKNYAAIEGYRLDVRDSMFLWRDVKTGDQFCRNGKWRIKAY